ncbi:unnamed protein product [Diamesa tonsa]
MYNIVLYRNYITKEIREIKDVNNVPDDVGGRHFYINLTSRLNERQFRNVPNKCNDVVNTMFAKGLWLPKTGLFFITIFSADDDDTDGSDGDDTDHRRKRRKIDSDIEDVPVHQRNVPVKNVDEDSGTDVGMDQDEDMDTSDSFSDDEDE